VGQAFWPASSLEGCSTCGFCHNAENLCALAVNSIQPRTGRNSEGAGNCTGRNFCRAWPLCRTTASSCATTLGHTHSG